MTLWRGSREVSAVWIMVDPRARVLAAWEPGARIFALRHGFVVLWPTPRRMACTDAPGMPLVLEGSVLSAGPGLSAAPSGATARKIVLPWQGALEVHDLGVLEEIAVHQWLDVSVPLTTVTPLGSPPAPPTLPAAPALRATFGRGPPDPRAVRVAEALEGAAPVAKAPMLARAAGGVLGWLRGRRGAPRATGAGVGGAGGAGRGVTVGRPGFFARLFGRLFPGGAASAPTSGGAPSGASDTPIGRALAPAPSWLERLARRLAAPMLAPMLDRQHSQYMTDLLDLFDQGKLDDALRRAIPLGGGLGPPLPPALTLPKPRADLALQLNRSPASTSVGGTSDVHALLRETYTRAAEKLIAAGRFEDAAFVYVELLRDPKKAIDLLDRHEKWALAAEIAVAGSLGPEVAARLYARAGQLDRAIALARRTGSFAVCLPVIEAADKPRGKAFRAAWAGHLAACGDPAGAVGVSWPEPELRPMALRWLDEALELGGVAGARLLPLRLAGSPDRYDDVRARVEPMLTGDAPEDIATRLALAEGLAEQAPTSLGARTLGRALTRRLYADQAANPALVRAESARRLAPLLADPAFQADLPALSDPPPLVTALTHRIDPSDRGSAPVHDVALLPRGRLLVALGEIGARLYDRDGRLLAVFDEPAEELVVHDAGTRAIAVARRGGACRLARLDLVACTATRWFDATLGPVTATYDGSLWFVAEGTAVLALDPTAERATTVWRVDTRGPVHALRRGAGLAVWVGGPAPELWRYTFPNLRLDERAMLPEDPWQIGTLGQDGGLWEVLPARIGEGGRVLPVRVCRRGSAAPTNLLLPAAGNVLPRGVDASGRIVVYGEARALVYTAEGLLRLDLDRRGGGAVVGRLSGDTLVVGDALGRVDAYDLRVGTCVARVRV